MERGAVEVASVAGLTAYVVPNPGPRQDCTYTNGSRMGSPPSFGSSAVLPDGHIVVCRVPGNPNSYRVELAGILLGSHFSSPHACLRVACKGAIAPATGSRRPVKRARWVMSARNSLLSKNQSVEWIKGHTAHVHQERSDEYAKYGSTLPPPPPTGLPTIPLGYNCQG